MLKLNSQSQPVLATSRLGQWLFYAVALLTLAILVGHGCHGDEVDHEPSMLPTEVNHDR